MATSALQQLEARIGKCTLIKSQNVTQLSSGGKGGVVGKFTLFFTELNFQLTQLSASAGLGHWTPWTHSTQLGRYVITYQCVGGIRR